MAAATLLYTVTILLRCTRIPLPFVPTFVGLSFSSLPRLVNTFIYKPLTNILVTLVGGVFRLVTDKDNTINRLSGFLLNTIFIFDTNVVCGGVPGFGNIVVNKVTNTILVNVTSLPLGGFVVCPLCCSIVNFPGRTVLSVCHIVEPDANSVPRTLLIFGIPFAVIGNLVDILISVVVCGPLDPVLRGGGAASQRGHEG